jgi:hypothetical protein
LKSDRYLLAASAVVFTLLAAGAASAQAQPAAAPPSPAEEEEELEAFVVTAGRLPGAVPGDIQPVLQLGPRDIRAYGLNSVSELIEALQPQTESGQGRGGGRPAILVNGARVTGFNEIRDIPTEAVMRVDILPEEVALKFGYPVDQQVINLVLRPRFRALTAELAATLPTESGGGAAAEIDLDQMIIRQGTRFQLDGEINTRDRLLESERGIQGRTDPGFRTLVSAQDSASLNAILSKPLGRGVSGTVNATLEAADGVGWLGLSPFEPLALERRTKTLDATAALGFTGALKGWLWTYNGGVQRSQSRNTTERARPDLAYTDTARSVSTTFSSDLVASRSLFSVPAGRVSTTLSAGARSLRFDSDSLRAGVVRSVGLARDSGELKASLDLPLVNRNRNPLGPIGNLSVNLNAAVEDLSDFGALKTYGYGLNWSPIAPVRVIASYSSEEGAPTVQQIGNPELVTPGVRVFDLRRGETADITRIDGGTRALEADRRRVLKLGLTLKPLSKADLTVTANYTNAKTRNVIAAFPSASTQVEDAFPERFLRDASGRLVQIDARPVNFDSEEKEQLRWGLNFRKTIKSARPQPQRPPGGFRRNAQQDGQPAAGGPPAGQGGPRGATGGDRAGPGGGGRGPGGGFRGGGFGGFGGGARGGVFQVGLYHTVVFKDLITIRPGLPRLDLLNGAATGAGGGTSRHQLDLQTNLTRDGLGISGNLRWQSATTVKATGMTPEDLRFSDLTTVNLRLFADLGQQPFAREHRWLRGTRASLSINNLFNQRQDVRTPQGVVPISYQPGYLNPLGRTVRFTVRKVF